jgi:hypothetical protein
MLPAMKKNADGLLRLFVQNESPGLDRESNLLLAPSDIIYLLMRFYWSRLKHLLFFRLLTVPGAGPYRKGNVSPLGPKMHFV